MITWRRFDPFVVEPALDKGVIFEGGKRMEKLLLGEKSRSWIEFWFSDDPLWKTRRKFLAIFDDLSAHLFSMHPLYYDIFEKLKKIIVN